MNERSPNQAYVWYHDLRWNKKNLLDGKHNDENGTITVELHLSDQRKILFKIENFEKLQELINSLENSL